jgi:predicted nucleic acid-binding protein
MAENPIVFDSGALTALANKEEAVRSAVRKALTAGARLIVPTVVVAASTTGDGTRDAAVNRVIKTAIIADCDLATARSAAALRFRVGSRSGTIDAIVVATADRIPGAVIVTADSGDFVPLAQVRSLSGVVDLSDF